MFGAPQPPSKDQLEEYTRQAKSTIVQAGVLAGLFWAGKFYQVTCGYISYICFLALLTSPFCF